MARVHFGWIVMARLTQVMVGFRVIEEVPSPTQHKAQLRQSTLTRAISVSPPSMSHAPVGKEQDAGKKYTDDDDDNSDYWSDDDEEDESPLGCAVPHPRCARLGCLRVAMVSKRPAIEFHRGGCVGRPPGARSRQESSLARSRPRSRP